MRSRPGKQRVLDEVQSQQIVPMACGPAQAGQARWSVRLIATEAVRRKLVAQVERETRRDYEYRRCGTANVFCAVEPEQDGTSPKRPPHASSQGGGGSLCKQGRRPVMAPLHNPLHASTRQLAEPGGD